MNSNSGKELRTNARCRTPLSNSLRTDHNRSTTELYSPRDAPTTHTTHTTPPPPPRARKTRSNAFPPCPEMLRPMRPLPTVFNGRHHPRDPHGSSLLQLPPDRSHDHLHHGSRAHTRSPAITRAPRTGSCTAIRARRTHTQRTHAEQHMTPARTAHALGAHTHTHTSSPPMHARTRTASSPPPPAATTSCWVYC